MHPKTLIFLAPVALFAIIAVIIMAYFNHKLRKHILDSNIEHDSVTKLFRQLSDSRNDALKWALVLFFGGLGLVVIDLLSFTDAESSITYGIEAIFIAFGFGCYYLIAFKNK